MSRSFQLTRVCVRPTPPPRFTFANANISASGDGLFLFVGDDEGGEVHARTERGIGNFPNARMASAKPYLLAVRSRDSTAWVQLPALDIAFPLVEIFADGRVLLAGARCSWRGEDDFDLNGAIYDPKDGTVKRILLGDGIADIAIDGAGRIWVSYFDEGIFGNFGWSNPGPTGKGAGGLVCFAEDGTVLWQFNREDGEGFIDDCYALNASREEIWAYYYSDFKVCRVTADFTQTFYALKGVAGSHAIVVSDSAILLAGGYGDSKDTFHLLRRNGDQLARPQKLTAQLPEASSFASANVVGRGRHLNVLTEDGWFQADLKEIEAQL